MPDVDHLRRKREQEAYKREELMRAERRKVEQREHEREMKDHERRRVEEMLHKKAEAKKIQEIFEAEQKSLQLRAEMGDKVAIRMLEERKKHGSGPRPYTGASDEDE